ncbi:MAG: radical SAM protein, partial [Sedimentisphaerales bacterium]
AIIPNIDELEDWGRLDPSDEHTYTVMPGMEHKYNSTVLMLVSNVCEGICRYCFRKRLFISPRGEHLRDLTSALQYIREHPEITNILLSGGDPLILKPSKLEEIVARLMEIEHIHIVRIGTKMPAFNPYRIIESPGLLDMIRRHSSGRQKIYIMTHFVHPRELTDVAVKAIEMLQKAGAIVTNQMPLIKGVNSDPEVLAELLAKLSTSRAAASWFSKAIPKLTGSMITRKLSRIIRITCRTEYTGRNNLSSGPEIILPEGVIPTFNTSQFHYRLTMDN